MVDLVTWCAAVSDLRAKCPGPRVGTLWVVGVDARGRYAGAVVTGRDAYRVWQQAANEIQARLKGAWTVCAAEYIARGQT